MKLTIYDIAKATDVSIATVSKVLNNKGSVSQATREKILETVKELGYKPSTIASALAGKNTNSIVVLIPDIDNPYYSEVLRGAENEAYERGYRLLICNTENNEEKERAYLLSLQQKEMDGLLIATGTTDPQTLKKLMAENIRIVLMGREIPGFDLACVRTDNFKGGYLAGKHLVELGHRSLGVITESLRIRANLDRLHGFESALKEKGLHYHLFSTEQSGTTSEQYGIDSGTQQALELLSQHPITGLFASNDQFAVGALQACKKLGKRVPEDVSIVSYDDTVFSKIVSPTLTAVSISIYDAGRKTASLMIDAIENGIQPTSKVIIDPTLVIRQSTGNKTT